MYVPNKKKMLLFVGRDEDVVLVLALLPGAVLERGHAVAVLLVIVPLALVLQAV